MHITYCENCGALIRTKTQEAKPRCSECKEGRTPEKTRGDRDSAMIPRSKIDNFLRTNRRNKDKQI